MKRKWCKHCLNSQMIPHDKVACRVCGSRMGFLVAPPNRVNTAQLRKESLKQPTTMKLAGESATVVVKGRAHKPGIDRLALFNAGVEVELTHRRPSRNRKLHKDQKALQLHAQRPYGRLLINWILSRKEDATVTAFAREIGSKKLTVTGWIKKGRCGTKHANLLMDMMISDGTVPALLNDSTKARWRAYQEATCQNSETSSPD